MQFLHISKISNLITINMGKSKTAALKRHAISKNQLNYQIRY